MCGIVGALGPADCSSELVRAMALTLRHRGPDGSDVAVLGEACLGLSRLAIMDVAAAADPFQNERGTVLAVCNGEIYNSAELRRELQEKGHRFRTQVDTEVIVHLWEEEGVQLVRRLDGMFAFALWDRESKTLMLGRDRAGEKPLYYRLDGERVLFSSELRGLLADPGFAPRLDPLALTQYLANGFFPAPFSPLAEVRKLPAGHVLVARDGRVEVSRYWDLADWFPARGAADTRSLDALADELDERLALACRRRSMSEVPFGVFLSGGIDSATVLAYLTAIHGRGMPAFTLGHTDRSFDEAGHAAETARFLGAELHELVLSRDDLAEGLRLVTEGMDEPLGDASIIPTFLLSRFARQRVKVVLSGEGADELFGGYPTYIGHRVADRLQALPAWLRHGIVRGARALLPVSMGNVGLDYLVERFAAGVDLDRLERHGVWFGSIDPRRVGEVLSPELRRRVGELHPAAPLAVLRVRHRLPDALAELLYADFTGYLQDDLLTKVDRTTMLASLEARAPFLDHELAQFVAGIPSRHKVRGFTTKAILRRTVRRRLPPAVLGRRKRGFNIPFSRWVVEGLGDELRERFSPARCRARGVLASDGVGRLIDEHMARRADHRKPLFALLALDRWCDRTFGEGAPVPIADSVATASELSADRV
jgi:asparagine synthase (glutamine-hydrolysing)